MRLNALKIGLLVMAGLAALTILPAGRLPDYKPAAMPANPPPPSAEEERQVARAAARLEQQADIFAETGRETAPRR
jgi:hypothetical protein